MVDGPAIALGLLGGGLDGIEVAKARVGGLGAAGVACVLFAEASLVAAAVASMRAPSARIAVRVGGSWIAAIGLLMLGWSMRGA